MIDHTLAHPASAELVDFRLKIKGMSDRELTALEAVLRRGEACYREELLALQYVIHSRLQNTKQQTRKQR